MALKKQITVKGRSFIQIENGRIEKGIEEISFIAYIKVVSVIGDKNEIFAIVQSGTDIIKIENKYKIAVSVADGSKNFIAQAYDHLKTLPEFAGATDC